MQMQHRQARTPRPNYNLSHYTLRRLKRVISHENDAEKFERMPRWGSIF